MKIQYISDLHMELADNSRFLKNVEFPGTDDIFVFPSNTFYLNNITVSLSNQQ